MRGIRIERLLLWSVALLLVLAFAPAHASDISADRPMRIVSLAPNMTEILFAIGAGPKVVGVTSFCDFPPEAREKPSIGGMSNPSLEAVVALRPDIVMMTTDGNPEGFDRRLHGMGVKTYVSTARSIYDLPDEVRKIGRVLGAEAGAEELAGRIEKAFEDYKAKRPSGRKVVFVIWPEPLIVAGPGTAVDDAIGLLGYENIASETGINYPRYSVEELVLKDPDYVIFGGKGGHGEMRDFSAGLIKRLSGISAVREGRVLYVGDGLLRFGPRVVDGIEELYMMLSEEGRG